MSSGDSGDWVFPVLDAQAAVRAAERQQVLTKPRKSLGRLEELPELLIAHAGVVRALRVVLGGLDWDAAMNRAVPHRELQRAGA